MSKPTPTPEATFPYATFQQLAEGLVNVVTNSKELGYNKIDIVADVACLTRQYFKSVSAPELAERVRELREALQLVWDIWEENQYPQSGAIAARMTEIKPLIEAALKPREGRA